MSFYSILLLLGVLITAGVGIVVITRNYYNITNVIFAAVTLFVSISTFISFLISKAGSEQEVYGLLHAVSSRMLIFPLSVNFYLALTNQRKLLRSVWFYFLLYSFPILVILASDPYGLFNIRHIADDFGWRFELKDTLMGAAISMFVLLMTLFLLVLAILYLVKSKGRIERKQAWYILVGFVVALLIPVVVDLPVSLFSDQMPEISAITFVVGYGIIAIAILKYDLFSATLENAAGDIMESVSDAVILTDNAERINFANKAAGNLFGRNPQDLIGHSIESFFENPIFQEPGRLKETQEHGFNIRSFSGELIPVMISRSPLSAKGNKGSAYIVHKITELRRVMDRLSESERQYRLVTESSMDIITQYDENLEFLYCSPAIRLLGYDPDNLLGTLPNDILHPDDREKVLLTVAASKEAMEPFQLEYRVCHIDGSVIWVETRGNWFEDEGRKYMVANTRDISLRMKMKTLLIANEEKYRLFLENFQGIAFRMTTDNKLEFLYGDVYNITGYTIDEFLRGVPSLWRLIHADDRVQMLKSLHMLRSIPNSKTTNECRLVRKDGSVRYLRLFFQNIVDEENQPQFIQAAMFDKTDFYELQNTIINSIIETEDRERTRFAEDLHDELGPLLSSIRMYVNLIQIKTSLEDKESLELIDFTKHLLDDAVQQAKNIAYNIMPEVLNEYGLVPSIKSYCSRINKANEVRIEILTETLDEQRRFDHKVELALYRVMRELIYNTMRHAQASTITIRFNVQNGNPLVEYTDNGVGFNVDEKLNAATTLGVRNVIHRIQSVQGNIQFFSSPGKGTRVAISW